MPQDRSKQRQACLACRAIKVRCLENEDQNVPCQRCQRLSIPCEYANKKRGRKTNAERAARVQSSETDDRSRSPSRSRHSLSANPINLRPEPSTSGAMLPGPNMSFERNTGSSLPNVPSSSRLPEHYDPGWSYPPTTSQPQSTTTIPARSTERSMGTSLDVTEYLDPELPGAEGNEWAGRIGGGASAGRVSHTRARRQPRMTFEDPLDLNQLSPIEAKRLVDLFHLHLNPMIAALDPQLHTTDYLRNTSPILFTAVLAASSKFFRRDLHSSLMSHCQSILNRAISTGVCELGLVQALMIMVYWKAPDDRSAWIKIGLAIRLAYQLRLHLAYTPHRPLPADDFQARRVLDGERVWFCLVCFDRMYSNIFGLPVAIRLQELGDCLTWAREHLHLDISVDTHLACSCTETHLLDALMRQAQSVGMPDRYSRDLLYENLASFEAHVAIWFHDVEPPPLPNFAEKERVCLKWNHLDTLLSVRQRLLDVVTEAEYPRVLGETLFTAVLVVDQMELIAGKGLMPYLQDVASCSLSSLGLFIHRTFWRFSPQQRDTAVDLLKRVYRCCQGLSADASHEQAAAAFIARFIRRVLRIISVESGNATPTMGEGSSWNLPETGLSLSTSLYAEPGGGVSSEFEQLLAMTCNVTPEDTTFDEQYWSSLFAAVPGMPADFGFAPQFGAEGTQQ